jgi:hypothetical protein
MESSSMHWTDPMSSEEVIERLRGEKANVPEGDHLIQQIIAFYTDVVSSIFAEHKKKFDSNVHHRNVLLSARASKNVPKFLQMETPVLKRNSFQSENSNLRTEFRSIRDKAAESMVEATIQEREKIDPRFHREAVKLEDFVRDCGIKKWMDALGTPKGLFIAHSTDGISSFLCKYEMQAGRLFARRTTARCGCGRRGQGGRRCGRWQRGVSQRCSRAAWLFAGRSS